MCLVKYNFFHHSYYCKVGEKKSLTFQVWNMTSEGVQVYFSHLEARLFKFRVQIEGPIKSFYSNTADSNIPVGLSQVRLNRGTFKTCKTGPFGLTLDTTMWTQKWWCCISRSSLGLYTDCVFAWSFNSTGFTCYTYLVQKPLSSRS